MFPWFVLLFFFLEPSLYQEPPSPQEAPPMNPEGPDPPEEFVEAGTTVSSGTAIQWPLVQVLEEPLPETSEVASWLIGFTKLVQAASDSLYRLHFKANTGFHLDLLLANFFLVLSGIGFQLESFTIIFH